MATIISKELLLRYKLQCSSMDISTWQLETVDAITPPTLTKIQGPTVVMGSPNLVKNIQ